jgi:hypothetical protein
MAENSLLPPPGGPARYRDQAAHPGTPGGRALVTAILIAAGTAVLGLVGGLIWAELAPRVAYQVVTLKPPTAYAVNPETNAFIAADGIYCFVTLAGGILAGLAGYLFIRRYGPVPMAGLVLGSVLAAFLAMWTGNRATGSGTFDHLLATSKPGAILRAPISLGSHGALAFWPLAAAAVVGGFELVSFLRARARERGSGG